MSGRPDFRDPSGPAAAGDPDRNDVDAGPVHRAGDWPLDRPDVLAAFWFRNLAVFFFYISLTLLVIALAALGLVVLAAQTIATW